ncbi:MAG: terminase [Muribaculaceae bacterium]|nr:terminase [Muribaculaceae bacterium]
MTIDEILKENDRRLARIYAPYNPTEGSKDGEIDFFRCQKDFEYWAASCCYIKNKQGGEDILFRLNLPQRKLVKMLEEMRVTGSPIRLILLKARQWGGSTCAQLYMAWLQLMHKSGLNSLIVAHQHAATSEIRDMFLRMLEAYPEKMLSATADPPVPRKRGRPKKSENCANKGKKSGKKGKRTEGAGPSAFRVIPGNFKVKVGSAERPDSCRGGDYSLVHCSEVALWKKTRLKTPEDMIRAACSGILLKPLTMILLESTANGTGNYFHTEYMAAKRGESQFRALFVAWYEIEQYSLPLAPEEREKFAISLLEGKDNQQPESDRTQPGSYLWWLWQKGATLEAINWYVKERAKYSDHAQMAAEYPSDDIEAFVHSGARVFNRYHVEALRDYCKKIPLRGEITGMEPSGARSLQDLVFSEDSRGALKIWGMPETNREYTVSDRYLTVVDIGGRSMKADWSVICVFDRAPMLEGRGPEVVAQWRGHTDFDLLAWNAARIAKFYSDSLLVVESNTLETHDRERLVEGNQAHYLLHQLRDAYPNLYMRKSSAEDIRNGIPVKYGFHTNIVTKPLIIANLVKVVRESLYVERDEMCLDEYLTYEQRPDGSYGAISGKHDDLLMTRAIGLHICFNEMEPPRRLLAAETYCGFSRPGSYAAF